MPRFFFHLQSGKTHVADHKGHELSGALDAYLHARKLIREAQPYLTEDDGRWIIRVQTEADGELIVLFPSQKSQQKTIAATRDKSPRLRFGIREPRSPITEL